MHHFTHQHVFCSGMLYVVDFFSKKAFLEASIKFPNSLVGMFVITGLLMAIGEQNAAPIRKFFAPALDWIAKVCDGHMAGVVLRA
jgi:hypothetical protein